MQRPLKMHSAQLLAATALIGTFVFVDASFAACTTVGGVTTCDTTAPNPWTTRVGNGPAASEDNRTLIVKSGSQINSGNDNAVTFRDNANITVQSGATVSNFATTTAGQYNTGGDTVEVRNNSTITVEQGGQILAAGPQNSGEAINPEGFGNTIINNGTIRGTNSAAIWFQNTTGSNTVINNETGVIQAPGNVIGASGNGSVDFTNKGMVIGNLVFAGGNDTLRLYTGSTITGNFNGGGGNNTIFLSGTGQSSLPGNMANFQTLIKNDTGTWTLTGTITGVTASTVQEGTLVLTGNNTNYTGTILVAPAGTLEARAQSLPPTVTDNGLVRFNQPDTGTYSGLISGTGVVEKTGAGVVTLAPTAPGGNTYSGGTRINQGVVAVGVDNALGASNGGITFNGGTLQLNNSFNLAATRAIVVNAPGGTVDTQGYTSTVSQGITGAGALNKAGSGALILTGNNAYTGGTTIAAGTLQLGNGGASGSIVGNVTNNGALAFNRSDTSTFSGVVSGSGSVAQIGTGATILTADNTYTGGTTISAGTLQLGNGGTSGSIVGNITNNAALAFNRSDTATYAGVISGSGSVAQIGAGTTVLTGDSSYTGGTTISAGTLQLGNGGTSGSIVGNVTNNATLAFNRSDTSTFGGVVSGSGSVAQIGTGTTILTANNNYTGGTTISAGTLAVGDAANPGAALSGGGPINIASAGTLAGFGSVTGDVTNDGTIAVANALPAFTSGPNGNFTINGTLTNRGHVQLGGNGVGNTLNVTNYVGQSGTMGLNTYLGTDGSPSDRLIVNGGTASGSTALQITNVGGPGAATTNNGILLVDAVNGGTTAPGAFSLAGPVAAGAREYVLFKGGVTGGTAQNWYLRSAITPPDEGVPPAVPGETAGGTPLPPTPGDPNPQPPNPGATPVIPTNGESVPLYRPEVPTYTVVPPALRLATLATLGTFHERRGEQSVLTTGDNFSAAWGRVFGQDIEQKWSGTVDPSIDGSIWGGQVGLDILRQDSGNGHRDTAGVFFGYSTINAKVKGQALGWNDLSVGDINADVSSLGGYWTHIGPTGWYVDGVLMGSWFNGSAKTNRGIGIDTNGSGITASLEGGYPISIAQDWVLEPQAQIIWQDLSIDNQNDGFSSVNFNTDNSWTGRVGMRLQGNVETSAGLLQPYLKANLWHAFDGSDRVRFGSDIISTDFGGTSLELGGGIVAAVTKDVSLFATADYTFEVDGEKQQVIKGNAGVRVHW
ncbi:autotransporter outer membrane beta-barrel domain-containing protein [uncultured Phyllobacterium sp.]|uniref:autotransporter outer membrane beta-barrel domain-containing protein n=1 Tax=uncultured Phyllobacterium sp. TaxID=253813 RepID=UPI002591187C|nr:autotransporter outer membrane beta-barrel domain-containing protein [uncultured Phyllobacterium sp.]